MWNNKEELIKESVKVVEWYMQNCKPDNGDYQTFFNLGANYLTSCEEISATKTEKEMEKYNIKLQGNNGNAFADWIIYNSLYKQGEFVEYYNQFVDTDDDGFWEDFIYQMNEKSYQIEC